MIGKLAIRNLTRNRWRTVLTMAGVALGVAILIWMNGYMMGFHDEMIRGATAAELGQVQIADTDWVETPSARHTFAADEALLARISSLSGIESAAPRVTLFGLVGDEERSVVAKIAGVDPAREAATTVVAEGLEAGRWLSPTPPEYPQPREVVLGKRLAEQLDAEVGDELVAFYEAADGSLGNELLEVVGIVSTGSSVIDRQGVFMHLRDLQIGAAMEGHLHQIALRITDPNQAPEVASVVSAEIGREDLSVRSWDVIMPEIKGMVEMMKNSDVVMYIFVYILVAFGLFNAQRMSALERRREFAMMMAIGVTPRQLFWTVLTETVLIAFVGALAGAVLGSLATWYFVVHGLDLAAFSGSGELNLDMMGISFSNVLYFAFAPEYVFRPMGVLVPFAILCGLWPAIHAARVEITTALSGRS